MRYESIIPNRLTIPIYGPDELGYAEHGSVTPRLEVSVAEPPTKPQPQRTEPTPKQPTRPDDPSPDNPWPDRPERTKPGIHINIYDLSGPTELLAPLRPGAPNVVYLANADLPDSEVRVIEGEPGDFGGIEHDGVIVVIEKASFLPSETFEIVGQLAEELGTETLPIYVRQLG